MKWTKESHSKSCFILACRRFYFLKYLYICRKDDLTVNQFLWEKSCLGEENWGKNCCFGGTENTLKSIQGAISEKQKKFLTFIIISRRLKKFICCNRYSCFFDHSWGFFGSCSICSSNGKEFTYFILKKDS